MSPATPPSRARARFVLAILFVVYVFNFIDRQILSILIGPIQNELGVSDTAMGLLSGFTFAIFYTLAGIPIARISDRGSRSGVIAVSLGLWSLMTAATGFAQSFWQLALARIGVGVGEAGGSPPSHSLLSDYFPPERRATALALYANGIYVGAGLAYLLGGWVVTHFDWRTAYFAIGLAGLPLALLVRATVREVPRGFWETKSSEARGVAPPAQPAPPDFASAVRELFAKPSFRLAGRRRLLPVDRGLRHPELGRRVPGPRPRTLAARDRRLDGPDHPDRGLRRGEPRRLARRSSRRARPALVPAPAGGGRGGGAPLRGALPAAADFRRRRSPPSRPTTRSPTCTWVPSGRRRRISRGPSCAPPPPPCCLFILNLIGLGLGPLAVGAVNDLLAPAYGAGAIRWSLLGVVFTGGLASLLYWKASQHLAADLAAARREAAR